MFYAWKDSVRPASLLRSNWVKKYYCPKEWQCLQSLKLNRDVIGQCGTAKFSTKNAPISGRRNFCRKISRWSRCLHVASDPFRSTACTRVSRSFLQGGFKEFWKLNVRSTCCGSWFRFVLLLQGLAGIVSSNVDRTSSKPVVAVFAKVLMNTRDASLVFFCSDLSHLLQQRSHWVLLRPRIWKRPRKKVNKVKNMTCEQRKNLACFGRI